MLLIRLSFLCVAELRSIYGQLQNVFPKFLSLFFLLKLLEGDIRRNTSGSYKSKKMESSSL